MSSFDSELLALVVVWRMKGADPASMIEALKAEVAGLQQHVEPLPQSGSAPISDKAEGS